MAVVIAFGLLLLTLRPETSSASAGSADCPCTIFGEAVPETPSFPDQQAVELGVRFQADQPGWVTGVRFYKGIDNEGPHTGTLWSSDGSLLVSGSFSEASSEGWQQLTFSAPVAVAAGTIYVASYHAPHGGYAADHHYFADSDSGGTPIRAVHGGADGSNGVFRYGEQSGFPSESYRSTNYWVDVVFTPQSPDAATPTPTSVPATPTPTSVPATPTPTSVPTPPTPTSVPATPTPTSVPTPPTPTSVPATPTPTSVPTPPTPTSVPATPTPTPPTAATDEMGAAPGPAASASLGVEPLSAGIPRARTPPSSDPRTGPPAGPNGYGEAAQTTPGVAAPAVTAPVAGRPTTHLAGGVQPGSSPGVAGPLVVMGLLIGGGSTLGLKVWRRSKVS